MKATVRLIGDFWHYLTATPGYFWLAYREWKGPLVPSILWAFRESYRDCAEWRDREVR